MKIGINSCHKCKEQIDWQKEVWIIGVLVGYRLKKHDCKCGNEQYLFVPTSQEELKFWEEIL